MDKSLLRITSTSHFATINLSHNEENVLLAIIIIVRSEKRKDYITDCKWSEGKRCVPNAHKLLSIFTLFWAYHRMGNKWFNKIENGRKHQQRLKRKESHWKRWELWMLAYSSLLLQLDRQTNIKKSTMILWSPLSEWVPFLRIALPLSKGGYCMFRPCLWHFYCILSSVNYIIITVY